MDDILTYTVENFDQEAVHSPLPVFIEFQSDKYPSCSRLSSVVDSLAQKYSGKVRFGRIDVDEQPKLASLLSVGGLPCTLIMRGGRIYANIGGILPLTYYERLLNRMLSEKSDSSLHNNRGIPFFRHK